MPDHSTWSRRLAPTYLSAGPGERHLRFKLTQNDSVQFPFAEFVIPLHENSLAGYSALHGEVINLADAHRIPRGRPVPFQSAVSTKKPATARDPC